MSFARGPTSAALSVIVPCLSLPLAVEKAVKVLHSSAELYKTGVDKTVCTGME